MKTLIVLALLWLGGEPPIDYHTTRNADPVVGIAVDMMCDDLEEVTGVRPVQGSRSASTVRIIQYDREKAALRKLGVPAEYADSLAFTKEAFYLGEHDGKLLIVGSDARGTAYGVLELSRLAGVSPWIWWGDSRPEKREKLEIPEGYMSFQHPSVEYRGIFLNDEDWAFRPWSTQTFSPQENPETISADCYREIFKLLLRLRANTLWPAMHPGTTAFFKVPGAMEAADSCAIFIGTSHCEPLLRNNVGEWDVKERGRYNFIDNREAVLDYWTERLKEMSGRPGLYTIGMRGIHDGSMEGVSTLEEKTVGLQEVIWAQRELLSKYVNHDVTRIPQMFMPYKEVLEIMENGLEVPEDVTIVWCDDNYGYMTRLSDEEQQKRSGGAGVYYHLSYCGRPHDHLWLSTTQPGLIYNEMMEAYKHNVRKIWIANVHDPKVAAYDMEFFLDLAWDVNCVDAGTVNEHLERWMAREFGDEVAGALNGAMSEYYRLCAMRKPEFMGWSQVELPDRERYPRGLSKPVDTEFSFGPAATNYEYFGAECFGGDAQAYIDAFRSLRSRVNAAAALVPERSRDAYFAAVLYPVNASGLMAEKMLYAQLARSRTLTTYSPGVWKLDPVMMSACAMSQKAYQEIRELTSDYNSGISGGKWKGNMSDMPRGLYVFWAPDLPVALSDEECEYWLSEAARTFGVYGDLGTASARSAVGLSGVADNGFTAFSPESGSLDYLSGCISGNASDFSSASFSPAPVSSLGHSGSAVPLPEGESIGYAFDTEEAGTASVRIAVLPTQAMDRGDIRFSVSVDNGEAKVFSLKEPYRSEQWKRNVMRQQRVVEMEVDLPAGKHEIRIEALDDHIVLDQWMVDFDARRKFYLFPVSLQ